MGSKYLFVINSFLAGGAERSLLELLPSLKEAGVDPIIACLRRRDVGFEDEVRENGFDVRLLGGSKLAGKILSLRKLIKSERPQLVYTSLFDSDLAGRLAAIGTGVPVMTNLANTAYDQARLGDPNVNRTWLRVVKWIDGFTARHLTDHFHAVSQAVKDSAVQQLGVSPERVTVVKRGRDPGRLGAGSPERRETMRRALGLDLDHEVVVSVGRQEYQKGHQYLVEAFASIAIERKGARLLIAGREGHATAALKSLIARLGLKDVVTLLGHRDDVADVLAGSDMFVFPSLYEGLGGALIEAIALGLPVVASDLPSLREVVEEGGNADLVPPGDAKALAEAISGLLTDQERRLDYGVRSFQIFERDFHSDAANRRMLEMFREVAAQA